MALDHHTLRLSTVLQTSMQSKNTRFIPRVERPDALLLADPEEGVKHASVAHLRVLGLTLDLQPGLSEVNGKCP